MTLNPIALAVIRSLGGLSQAELSRRANISQGHISGLESGDKAASPAMVRRLAEALGVPIASLITSPTAAQIESAKESFSRTVPATKVLVP